MNSLITDELPGNYDLRDELLTLISDEDLAYKLPGNNPTLGELCVEMGQTQQVYTHSFKTFKQDWDYRDSAPEVTNSVAALRAWYQTLDADLLEALSGLSEEDVHTKQIGRGYGFMPSAYVQFQIYREALLIFYAKASVYLRALEKQIPEQWIMWVG